MKPAHFTPVPWMIVSGGAFALGWLLKPPYQPHSAAAGPVSISSPASPASPAGPARGTETKAKAAAESAAAGALVSFTSEDISALGKSLRESTDPLAKREAFGRLLAGLTKENALEIQEQIDFLEDSDAMFREFHFAWGKIGGMEAVLHGTETPKSDMGPALAGWASADPAAARAWYDSLPEKGKGANRGQMQEAFVHGLAIADPAKAVDFVLGLSDAKDPRARQMMGIIAEKQIQAGGADSAASWAATLPDGEMRNHANYEIAKAKVRTDPAAAAAWAAPLAGEKGGGAIVYGISSEWSGRDGAATAKWLDTLSGDQSAAYGPAFAGWAKADPLAASERISSMPPSGNRDNAIGGLIHSYRWEDPVSSIAWANQIQDAKRREFVLALTAEAFVKKDPAAAAAWLPTSGLPAKTQQRFLNPKP